MSERISQAMSQQPYLFRSCGSDDVSELLEPENGQPGPIGPVRSDPVRAAVLLVLDNAADKPSPSLWDLRSERVRGELARLIVTAIAAARAIR